MNGDVNLMRGASVQLQVEDSYLGRLVALFPLVWPVCNRLRQRNCDQDLHNFYTRPYHRDLL